MPSFELHQHKAVWPLRADNWDAAIGETITWLRHNRTVESIKFGLTTRTQMPIFVFNNIGGPNSQMFVIRMTGD